LKDNITPFLEESHIVFNIRPELIRHDKNHPTPSEE